MKDIFGRKFDQIDIYRKIIVDCQENREHSEEVIAFYFALGYRDLGIRKEFTGERFKTTPYNIVVGNEDMYIYYAEWSTYTPRPQIFYEDWKKETLKRNGASLAKKLTII